VWKLGQGTQGELLHTLQGHTASITSVVLLGESPCAHAASGGADGNAIVWDVQRGARVRTLSVGQGGVRALAKGRGSCLLAGTSAGYIYEWDWAAGGAPLSVVNPFNSDWRWAAGGVTALSFHRQSNTLAFSALGQPHLLFYPPTGRETVRPATGVGRARHRVPAPAAPPVLISRTPAGSGVGLITPNPIVSLQHDSDKLVYLRADSMGPGRMCLCALFPVEGEIEVDYGRPRTKPESRVDRLREQLHEMQQVLLEGDVNSDVDEDSEDSGEAEDQLPGGVDLALYGLDSSEDLYTPNKTSPDDPWPNPRWVIKPEEEEEVGTNGGVSLGAETGGVAETSGVAGAVAAPTKAKREMEACQKETGGVEDHSQTGGKTGRLLLADLWVHSRLKPYLTTVCFSSDSSVLVHDGLDDHVCLSFFPSALAMETDD